MNKPRLSIITPVYNGERFIESCIKNVIEQNCYEVEHIIIDGNSTDRTLEVIKQYAQKYPHLRWLSEEDKGQADAQNKGVRMARGEIIGVLNVDDFYEPDVLNRVLKIFESLPEPSLVVANCNVWNNERLVSVIKPRKLKLFDLLCGPNANPFPVNPSSYFYHASLHKEIGLFDNEYYYNNDLDFILRAVQAAKIVKYFDETWGNFRKMPGTKTFQHLQQKDWRGDDRQIFNKYRRNLPLIQRVISRIIYEIGNEPGWGDLRYYIRKLQKSLRF